MTLPHLTGLLLGAGASYEAGLPLVWELTEEIKKWLTPKKLRELNTGWRVQGAGYSEIAIDDFSNVLERDDLHYESILGYLETQFKRHHRPPLRDEYHGLYSWLVEMVYHLLYFRQVRNGPYLDRHLPYYDGLKALADTNKPLWIFSLNHDVIVEEVAARLSVSLYSGFSDTIISLPTRDARGKKHGELKAQVLTKAHLDKHAMYFPNPPQKGIYLLKLHGALDIFSFNDGNDLLKLMPDAARGQSVIEALKAANEELLYAATGIIGQARACNHITYADDEGVMQFLERSLLAGAFKYHAHVGHAVPQSLLEHFKSNINFVTNLVSIGYSFGDNHINQILKEWLEFSATRTLEIVDPCPVKIPSFLLHLAPQISITQKAATDYLDSRAGISRSPEEGRYKEVSTFLRKQGRERVASLMPRFFEEEAERISRAYIDRASKLPWRDGTIDLSSVGEPQEVAKVWAAEIRGSDMQLLDRIHQYFELKT